MKDIKIMSFNLWCINVTPARSARVFEAIRRADPDILGVQEATPHWMQLLSEAFPAYIAIGEGRDGGDEGEYSAIFVKADRFSVEESGTHWLTDTPTEISCLACSCCPRVYTYAHLYDRENNTRFCHVNTHLDHIEEWTRLMQAWYLHEFIDGTDVPCTVTGDFNCIEETSPTYKFVEMSGLDDAKKLADSVHAAITFHGYGEEEEMSIDFCFVTRDAFSVSDYRVADEKIDGEYPSDHHPVIVTLVPNG